MYSELNYQQGYFCNAQLIPENASILFQNLNEEQENFWSQGYQNLDQVLNKRENLSVQLKLTQKSLKDTADQDQSQEEEQNIVQQISQQSTEQLVNKIQCEEKKTEDRNQILKGQKDDTGSLNRNLKSLLLKFCNQGVLLNKYNSKEKQILKQFKNENSASFKLLKKLIQHLQQSQQSNLKKTLKSFINSQKIVKYIMKSKSLFLQKLRLVKFLEIARKNLQKQSQIIKWKENKQKLKKKSKQKQNVQGFSSKRYSQNIFQKDAEQIQIISMYLDD